VSRGTSVGGYAPGPKPNQDRDLSLVNAAYVRAYKKTLLHAVEAESSGDYKRLLSAYVRQVVG